MGAGLGTAGAKEFRGMDWSDQPGVVRRVRHQNLAGWPVGPERWGVWFSPPGLRASSVCLQGVSPPDIVQSAAEKDCTVVEIVR